ncbi:hypothetical protein [Peribacillus loiseleuriae]|uniref:Uncharacterized protein n=1 Tax=Peribacillus loiseleuriae TaxID=1679170 RepID=A0A0K9GRM1_9BACI|nr:hypothetical protein [Peribacillus loiseleuriae]KMY49251.1 hypothetical protein AC625_06715 [Peribacillus loiseleuriae]
MFANIFQLSAGILLGIASFIVTDTFQFPVFGKQLPGSLERYKQTWLLRIGLILLVIGYIFPILDLDSFYIEDYFERIIFSFVSVTTLVINGYIIGSLFAEKNHKNAPVVGDVELIKPGMVALDFSEEKNEKQ